MEHPYKDNQEEQPRAHRRSRRYENGDWVDFANDMVQLGTDVGSTVLSSISEALQSVGDNLRSSQSGKAERTVANQRLWLDKKLKDSWGGYLALAIVGGIFAGSFGIAWLVMGIMAAVYPVDYNTVFQILAQVFGLCTAGFGVMFGFGLRGTSYFGRLRKYLRVLRDWKTSVEDIARTAAMQRSKVQKDLQKATVAGHLPNTCLDAAGQTFYLDDTMYCPTPEPAPASEQAVSEQERFRREGVAFLDYLRNCKGRLSADADEELAKMQKTCGAIMGFVHNHPEQLPRLRRFRDYYLPTTRKLLDTAQGLGQADADNADKIRQDITGILHTLNMAYSRLYDTLLQDVSLDVSAEIDTLETMLSQDGLTHDFTSDFGMK